MAINDIESCAVDDVQFEIKAESRVSRARINYHVSYSHGGFNEFQVDFLTDTLWIDPYKRKAVKSHLRISTGNPQHRVLLSLIRRLGAIKCGSEGFILTAGRGGMIRYGQKGGILHSDTDTDYETYYFYDSHVMAIKACMSSVMPFVQVGGLDAISLRAIKPDFIIEFGFERIPDINGVGHPMWKGDAKNILNMGRSYASYHERKENAIAFVDHFTGSLENEQQGH